MAKSTKSQRVKVKKLGASKLKRHFSSGGAVFRKVRAVRIQKVEWLLVKPAGTNRWQLPKGTIDPGEKSADTAVREVFEETGAKAKVLEKIDTIKYFFNLDKERIFKSVVFYLMESEDGAETAIDPKWEHEIAEAIWLPFKEAEEKLTYSSERTILQKARNKVEE